MTVSYEQLKRRADDALNTHGEELSNGSQNAATQGAASTAAFQAQPASTMDRIKGKLIEKVFPKINLTTQNHLNRVRHRLQQELNQSNQRYDDLWKQFREVQSLLQTVAPDRDRLASAIQDIQKDLKALNVDRDRLAMELQESQVIRAEKVLFLEQLTKEHSRLTKEVHILLDMVHQAQKALINRREIGTDGATASPLETVQQVTQMLYDPRTVEDVRQTMIQFFEADGDPNLQLIMPLYDQVLKEGIPYWDIRITARVLSRILKPQNYLEIGTRRGWSLAQVFAEVSNVKAYVFDIWYENYADAQGNPEFIREKMREVTGGEPQIEFINGNSHDTLNQFFNGEYGEHPHEFDLITVDGDHSLIGAWQDLYDVFPHVRVGGAVLFDDLEYQGDPSGFTSQYERPPLPENLTCLRDVWHKMQGMYPNFVFIDCTRLRYQAGIAIRVS